MMGVGRDAANDIFNLHEKERVSTDDAGATPQPPYPLEPQP
jgi:hypothetical protein